MSNIFKTAKKASNDVEDDFLGGGGILETDIYPATIKYAYIGKAQSSDARNVTLCLKVGNSEVTERIWMTNRNGEVTYTDKKTKELKNLPGFNQIDSLCMLVAGKSVTEMDVEDKTLNLYDFDSKKEIPQSVPCFTDLHGENIQVAIQRQTVDKQEKDGAGNYVNTGETRDINTFVKFFPEDKLVTISEVAHFISQLGGSFEDVLNDGDLNKAIAKMDENQGQYAEKWLEKNRGQTWNRAKGAGKGGKSFDTASGNGGAKKSTALFDD